MKGQSLSRLILDKASNLLNSLIILYLGSNCFFRSVFIVSDDGSALKISNRDLFFLAPLSRNIECLRDLVKILTC